MTIFRFDIALLLMVALTSCSEKISDEELICRQSPGFIETIGSNSTEQLSIAKQCIHKWAYRFGRAPGSNSEIGKVVVAKCGESIGWILTYKIREEAPSKQSFTDAMWQKNLNELQEYALIRVTEGRAGNCSIRGVGQK